MKKTLLLFVLFVISTTNVLCWTGEKQYSRWGSLSDGGIKSTVPYPKKGVKSEEYKINPSSYGKYLGFSVFLKTTNVNDKVAPWIQVGYKNENIKYYYGSIIKGTTSWKRYYTPHIYVPSHAEWVLVGVSIYGAGKVEFYDDKIKEYSYK